MRRINKQIVAIVMAAAMMGSLTPPGGLPFTQETVMAAEQNTIYESSAAKQTDEIDFSALSEEDWANGKASFTYDYTNGQNVSVLADFKLKGRVSIDETAYKTLAQDGNHIKLQGVVKLGSDWTYTTGDSWPYLDRNAFQKGEDGKYYADTEVEFKDKTPDQLMEIDYEIVGVGFKGTLTFDNVSVENVEKDTPELEEKEPTVLSDFEEEAQMNNWSGETGYQYWHGGDANAQPDLLYDAENKQLKVNLDYTANSSEGWSEAKVKYTAPDAGVDVSQYNQVSIDLIYPESGSNISKLKFFSDGIINKDTEIDTSNAEKLSNGYQKVTVTMGFSPSKDPLKDLTIGIIGSNSNFKGDVYLDNLTLSQKDETADYVKITESVNPDGTQADITKAAKTVTIADENADDSAKALASYLNGLSASGQVLFGHQNDVSKSVNPSAELGDVYDITGSVSGVFGIDTLALAGSEAGGTSSADALEKSVAYSKKAAENGALITLSTHMPNFTSDKIKKNSDGSYDFHECDFAEAKDLSNDSVKKILTGGEYNEVFNAYLDIIADYANQLGEDGIPVIFRPLHENTGSWFWWGSSNSVESYKSLYRYTRDYLEAKGVHNMLYVYSPNGPLTSEDEYLTRYPGDEYVDILAFDYYDDYNSYPAEPDDSYFTHLNETCKVVSSIAEKRNKIAAISECGVRVMKANGSDNEGLLVKGNPVASDKSGSNWYQSVSNIAKENHMPYYLVWANFGDTNFYVPYKYNSEYGQEMINDFISYYNDSTSVFGDGTNFYQNVKTLADQVTVHNFTNVYGYMTAPFDLDTLLTDTVLSANVKNASKVSFVIRDTATGKQIELEAASQDSENSVSKLYTAKLTTADMERVGKTDVAQISLKADGQILSTVENISLGKEKEKAPKNVVEDFDYYSGSDGLLDAGYTANSAAGCESSFTLDADHKVNGTYGGAFHYKLKTDGKEVWTGRIKTELSNHDFSAYNALQMWVQPDGNGQKLVVQLTDGSGEEFEVYLTNFVKGTKAQFVTVPFSAFKGKQGGTLDTSNITKFAIWCNSYPAGTGVNIDSTIYFDAIRAVTITDEQIAMKNEDQLILTDNAIGTPALTETTPDPTPKPDPVPTPDPAPTPTPESGKTPGTGESKGTESTSSETAGPGEETVSFEKQMLADIEAAASGDVVTKTVPDGEVVSRAVLAKAKEKGIRLILESKAGASVRWAFDRIDTEMDFNPMVKTGVEIKGVKDLLKKASLPDKMKYITVSFAHNGALPGTAKVTLSLAEAGFADHATLYLYYYNAEKGYFEYVDASTIEGGQVTFSMTHCSDYIVTDTKLPAGITDQKAKTTPDTGDHAPISFWCFCGIAGMAAISCTRRKKGETENNN